MLQQRKTSGHKRGISETIDIYQNPAPLGSDSIENSPDHVYRNVRHSLRPLPQPSLSSPTTALRRAPKHSRSHTADYFPHADHENSSGSFKPRLPSTEPEEAVSPDALAQYPPASPNAASFVAPDLQELEKSSTSHLRALSRFAQKGNTDEFSLPTQAPAVVGLQNRRRLKRTDSPQQSAKSRTYGFGERNWMDKQRQFLQAYEYLCHIGEAKEWIEDIIHQPIPPIVELEEALRNGVTLAEIVQAFHPEQPLRIFRNTRLQFKHSDNIVLFFRFLEDVGLPELFRFELIDLYEKKNIPKVIYCIHALSWLLYRKGMVDFRIGNLVGQLQFQDHELEQTQRGLDKAGVSMPSFSGMGASFGAEPEPEPEPVESEEERIDRELQESEAVIESIQSQMRGALVRLQLGDVMNGLWDHEQSVIELQSIIRGDWSRQVAEYRLGMQRFAISLQAATRGFLKRRQDQNRSQFWQSKQDEVLKIQSLFRAGRARKEVRHLKTTIKQHDQGVRDVQAAIRGLIARRTAAKEVAATRTAEKEIRFLQASIRGMLARDRVENQHHELGAHYTKVTGLQSAIRAMFARNQVGDQLEKLEAFSVSWAGLQAAIRGREARQKVSRLRQNLRSHSKLISRLQAYVRGNWQRQEMGLLLERLDEQHGSVTAVQQNIRGFLTRGRLAAQHAHLCREQRSIVRAQAAIRGGLSRKVYNQTLTDLHNGEDRIVELQSAVRAVLCRSRFGDLLSDLEEHEEAIALLQAAVRAGRVRAH